MFWKSLQQWLKVRPHTTKTRKGVVLNIEQLERRDCPTASISVLDNYSNLVLPSNGTPINSFSNWSMSLQAQVSGVAVTSYSWSLGSDATSVSGSSSYNVQFSWASFTGSVRNDSISVTANYSGGSVTQTFTYHVTPTSSPAWSSAPVILAEIMARE